MKAIFFALFVVAVTAAPLPEDVSGNDAVEMIVNGVPDGAALEAGNIMDIKLKVHADGEVVATDLLHPYSAVGIAEAAAATATAVSNDVSVVDNDMAEFARNLHPMPIVIPSPGFGPIEIPSPVIPSPGFGPFEIPRPVIPEPIVMPLPAVPEVDDKPDQLPIAAPQFNSDMYDDGHVQVQYNGPEEPGTFSPLQKWFQVLLNSFSPAGIAPTVAVPEPKHLHIHHH